MDATPRLTGEDKRTLGLSSLGGALEFYDFVIYVFYAKIISELFFPAGLSPFWAMLNTYGIFAAGYLVKRAYKATKSESGCAGGCEGCCGCSGAKSKQK